MDRVLKRSPILLYPRKESSLTLVTMTNAREDLIKEFVVDNITLGAKQVWVYIDDGIERRIDIGNYRDHLTITYCDDIFWKKFFPDGKPIHVESRQTAIFNHAYRKIETNWVGFCDIDERFVPKTNFELLFDRMPDDVGLIAAQVWEAIWHNIADQTQQTANYARRAITNPARIIELENKFPLFSALTKGGLCGHISGKVIIRSGIDDITVGIHSAWQGVAENPLKLKAVEGHVDLLHYDAISYTDWLGKFENKKTTFGKMGGDARPRRILAQLLDLASDAEFKKSLFSTLYSVDSRQMEWLDRKLAIRKVSRSD